MSPVSERMTVEGLTRNLSIGPRRQRAICRALAISVCQRLLLSRKNTVEIQGSVYKTYDTPGLDAYRVVCSTPCASWTMDIPSLNDTDVLTHVVRTCLAVTARYPPKKRRVDTARKESGARA